MKSNTIGKSCEIIRSPSIFHLSCIICTTYIFVCDVARIVMVIITMTKVWYAHIVHFYGDTQIYE